MVRGYRLDQHAKCIFLNTAILNTYVLQIVSKITQQIYEVKVKQIEPFKHQRGC